MKVRIKNFNGELPEYLTVGKWYKVTQINSLTTVSIKDDNRFNIQIKPDNCAYLNGGSWEVVE